MKYKVVLANEAEVDLRGIYEYIAFELLESVIAARQLERIENAIRSLDEMPYRYKTFNSEPWNSRGLHQLSIDNYIVFYIPNKEEKTVVIIRVMYSGRDIEEQLKNNADY